jgi:hypothetical protein
MTVITRFVADQPEAIGPNCSVHAGSTTWVPLAPVCECSWCETGLSIYCAGPLRGKPTT